jgi:hypothetical protein
VAAHAAAGDDVATALASVRGDAQPSASLDLVWAGVPIVTSSSGN